jgi:type VI secretion system protein ImpB
VEERQPVNVDGNNFDEVLRAQRVELSMQVDNVLHPAEAELSVNLRFNALKDFEPEAVARQIPELCALLELREALTELKGPLSQNTEFRRHLQRLLDDGSARHRVRGELGLGTADQSEDA